MDANGRPSTIVLKIHGGRYDEGRAAGTITPGDLIVRNSSNALIRHGTDEGAVGAPMFAMEDSLQGKTINQDYASGDVVRHWIPVPGDELFARLKDGENVSPADYLVSAGDGTLKKMTDETRDKWIARPAESLDLSGVSNTTAKHIKVIAV